MRRNASDEVSGEKIEGDRKSMWVGTGTGIYLITSLLLGAPLLKPLKATEWVLAGLNAGHT
jgi:hypothetical protein